MFALAAKLKGESWDKDPERAEKAMDAHKHPFSAFSAQFYATGAYHQTPGASYKAMGVSNLNKNSNVVDSDAISAFNDSFKGH
ncbi:hypothetical protein GUITHDRAFT_150579 [Guillardia theta CCMP2712]|uniref:Uncharacterized protein n=1 Tax=Guillardia theta (strain CCMP2712) TaxID=905079 RepID=L1JW21_GUITC|nr:hypothetical protein GUITHDRAFT_150579 [Guillardia theta CCMP2712]EKX52534.1 hypothetical protein GUITHDRAFT_150579 [Guillardia theta CCMP2712]|mmetsp:Transcript_21880/g.72289  ORF Transcript_21880/g.72289 Transcript_21880/m.72289 type:complete len:83 (-) Transcript_21880:381-629(-)|eukprot:XP_005839514.1 hypothetical protein GUITHDRAFT_150579 [Guillardia theta CCMP2712]